MSGSDAANVDGIWMYLCAIILCSISAVKRASL